MGVLSSIKADPEFPGWSFFVEELSDGMFRGIVFGQKGEQICAVASNRSLVVERCKSGLRKLLEKARARQQSDEPEPQDA